MTKAQWVRTVDRLMKRDWRVSTTDAGLSDEELDRYWRNGDEAAAFVAWFASKYDLVSYEPFSVRARQADLA